MFNNIITKKCVDCGCEFNTEQIIFLDRVISFQKHCDQCILIATEKRDIEEQRQKLERREAEFWEMVPKIYQTTDETQISPQLKKAIREWKYGPIGLGLKGPSGTQKTRASVLLLHSLHKGGRSVYFLKATNLTKNALEAFSDDRATKKQALDSMRQATECHVLLLDDVGKGRLSPSAEESLYALLDTRTENMLPTIWTTNADASQLHDLMSEDRGDAILRRLVEFSKIITIQ